MLHNIVLCYHGFTNWRSPIGDGSGEKAGVAPFRSTLSDFQAQVRLLQRLGYQFVSPTDYVRWWRGEWTPAGPICCIQADDGLASIGLAFDWLIEQQIPFGLAIISRKQRFAGPREVVSGFRTKDLRAESGFAEWSDIRRFVDSGYCELMHHTYNLHYLAIVDQAGSPAPVLDSPPWVDAGDFVYQLPGETRHYFDWSQIDTVGFGFPLFGCDPWGGYQDPVTSTLHIVPKITGTIVRLRLWAALHRPGDAGYSCQVRLSVRNASTPGAAWTTLGTVTVGPYQYETRAQWTAREFYTIELPASFNVTAGQAVELRFETLTVGRGIYLIFAVPDGAMEGGDYRMWCQTSCRALTEQPDDSLTPQYRLDHDYPAGAKWPMRPGIILSTAGGAMMSNEDYTAYVLADLDRQVDVINRYLRCEWVQWSAYIVISVSASHGSADIPFEYGAGGDPIKPDEIILCGTSLDGEAISSVWYCESESSDPVHVISFDTAVSKAGEPDGTGPQTFSVRYTMAVALEMSSSASGPWVEIGAGYSSWVDVELFPLYEPLVIPAGQRVYFRVITKNPGAYPAVRYSRYKPDAPFMIVHQYKPYETPGAPVTLSQICYPFGAFYQDGDGVVEASKISSIHPALEAALASRGITAGFTIWPNRNVRALPGQILEPDKRVTDYTLGRLLIYGDQPPRNVINNILAHAGALFEPVVHGGVQWQVSIEPDPAGNATIRRMINTLAYAAFDAWFFRADGTILPGTLNDGGTYSGITYADDKGWLQSRGVRCLLIVSNYNADIGDIDPALGSTVVNNPGTYVPQLVNIAVGDGWDGITCNLEGVPPEDRAAATAFYQQLGRALHAAGKLLHCTAPAKTGTDYDATWWTDWCDHNAIVKCVDAMKIMSYTESNETTEPGPHAPDAFMQQVYDYCDQVIPHQFRPRLLVGCNCFGHTWGGNPGFATYTSALAEGLRRGAYIREQDGEATWSAFGNSGWFGTPGTIRRAINIATARGYGGIGLWMADAGDLIEHYPDRVWIGRTVDMAYIPIRFPDDIAYGAQGGPTFNTQIVATDSGRENRVARWDAPLRAFTVGHRIKSPEAYERLLSFFLLVRGRAHTFRFRDWTDYKLTGQVLGTGDGSRVAFQLIKTYSFDAYSVTRTITRPLVGTLSVRVNGNLQTSGYSVNWETGVITFSSPVANGAQVSASCEFDTHCRFDVDRMDGNVEDFEALSWEGVQLFEVRAA